MSFEIFLRKSSTSLKVANNFIFAVEIVWAYLSTDYYLYYMQKQYVTIKQLCEMSIFFFCAMWLNTCVFQFNFNFYEIECNKHATCVPPNLRSYVGSRHVGDIDLERKQKTEPARFFYGPSKFLVTSHMHNFPVKVTLERLTQKVRFECTNV